MTVRKLPGTATINAHLFWDEIENVNGWKIQYNSVLNRLTPLNPVRLLDPQGHLWASAANLEEMSEALPGLIKEFESADPLLSREEVVEALIKIAKTLLTFVRKK